MVRALRGRRRAARAVTRLFGVCRGLQRVPGLRGWSSDELTVLARKEATYPVGFQYLRVRPLLDQLRGRPEHDVAAARLREARRRGWLDEHVMLKALTDEAGP
jgi:hypothetical protein